jgi:hypothetical protein
VHFLEESESHSTTYDHFVNLGKHVPDELNLVSDLGTTENNEERPFRGLKCLSEVLEFLLHEVASSSDFMVDSNHGRVGSVGCSESVVDKDFSERGELLSEISDLSFIGFDLLAILDAFAFLLNMVSEIFEENDLTVSGLLDGFLDFIADAVIEEFNLEVHNWKWSYLLSEKLLKFRGNWGH